MLFQLRHDEPIVCSLPASDNDTCFLALLDASLRASLVQSLPHFGLTTVDRYLERGVMGCAVESWCRRKFASGFDLNSSDVPLTRTVAYCSGQGIRDAGISAKGSGRVAERETDQSPWAQKRRHFRHSKEPE
jgi:hypothetical protein